MSNYPKIDDFLEAVEDSTEKVWNSYIQRLYTQALNECVFADRVVREMLPHSWEDWVVVGIANNTPAEKWMSATAPQFWCERVHSKASMNQLAALLYVGCALEHSNVGHFYLGVSQKGPEVIEVAKRLVKTDDATIVNVLKASSKTSTNVCDGLLSALADEHWDFNAVWEDPQLPRFQKWIQRMVKVSNGGSVFAPLISAFTPKNLDSFSQWVVDLMIAENAKKQKLSRNLQHFDEIFEEMPPNVAQKWIDHLSTHSPNPKAYGPLVVALMQNKQLRDALNTEPTPEVPRRKM